MSLTHSAGGIIFTTVQKFSLLDNEDEHPLICNRSNVVVISDEAHRSQYGLKARLKQIKDKETGEVVDAKYVFGFAKHMRDALPNASFIGFTGTPIDKEDKDTRGVFGDYVSIYDIQDAVDDGATVPIYYESRLVKIDINRAAIDELNKNVEVVIEDEEDVAAREKTKGRWAELAKLVGSGPRLAEVAADVVAHFEKRTASVEGKARHRRCERTRWNVEKCPGVKRPSKSSNRNIPFLPRSKITSRQDHIKTRSRRIDSNPYRKIQSGIDLEHLEPGVVFSASECPSQKNVFSQTHSCGRMFLLFNLWGKSARFRWQKWGLRWIGSPALRLAILTGSLPGYE